MAEMKARIVYLLIGTCGEYSSREDWPVAAYSTKAAAELRWQLCEEFAKGTQKTPGGFFVEDAPASPHDPLFRQAGREPTIYSLTRVPLDPEAPK